MPRYTNLFDTVSNYPQIYLTSVIQHNYLCYHVNYVEVSSFTYNTHTKDIQMTKKSKLLHDSSIVVRLPKTLHEQLEQVATAQFMKMGELLRNLIKEEVKRASPYLNSTPQALNQSKNTRGAIPPSQRETVYYTHPITGKQEVDDWN